jgi:hypothetical protein
MIIKKTIYVNSSGVLTSSATDSNGFQISGTPLLFKRGDTVTLNIIFLNAAGEPVTLANGTQLIMAVKPINEYDSQTLYAYSTLTVAGQVAASGYDFNFDLNSTSLSEALRLNEPFEADVAAVTGMLELSWTTDGGETYRSTQNVAPFTVNNDVIRGTESTPLALPSPEAWLNQRAIRFDSTQTLSSLQKARAQANIGLAKTNWNATDAPNEDNDETEGYSVGSLWLDATGKEAYRCVKDDEGAAEWIETTLDVSEVLAAASSAATPNTLVLRAADGTFSAASTAEEVVTITANASGWGSAAISGVSTGTDNTGIGVAGFSENGIGVSGGSDDGTALVGISGTGTGGLSVSNSGTYHHKFGQWDVTTLSPAQSAVERVRGWFVWFFGEYVGRLKTADITASREWTLPDESGTVALARNTGKTIFVDAGTGNDTRGSLSPYSISVPFATIGAAVAESLSGDTVRVRAGAHFVADTIALAGKGDVHFEDGAEVTFTGLGKYLFTLTANQSKSITGYGVFILAQETAGFFQTGGGTNTVQLVNIECGAIQAHSTVVKVFDLYTGVVVLKATTIQAVGAKVAIVQGTSTNFHYDVKFTYCSQLLDIPVSNSNSQFSCVAWTVICYGAYGLRIVGGTTSLELKNLNMQGAGTPVAFEFANNDANPNAHTLHGGRIFSGSTAPCISFATSTATQKFVKLKGDVQLVTGGTACITAGSARQVAVSSAHSNVAVGANVTVVGALTVNAAFTY